MTTLKEKTSTGLFWGVVNSGSTQLLNALIGFFLLRLLLPSDYGTVGVLAIFTALAVNLQDSGFTAALINRRTIKDEDYNAVFWFSTFVSLSLYTILFFAAPLIANHFHQPVLVPTSRLVFLSFVLAAIGIPHQALLHKKMMNKEKTITGFYSLLLSGGVSLIMAWKGMAFWSLVANQVLYIFFVDVFRFYYTRWVPKFSFNFTPIREMVGFSYKILITSVINTLNGNILTFIFGSLYSIRSVGLYTQANKWNGMGYSFINMAIQQVAQPVLASIREEKNREKRVFRKMLRFTAFLAFPLMLGLSFVANEFVVVTIGEKWVESVPLLRVMCVAGSFVPLQFLYQNLAISNHRSDVNMWFNVAQLLIQLGIIVALHPWGIMGMVAGTSVFSVCWLLVWQLYARRQIGLTLLEACKDIFVFFLVAVLSCGVTCLITFKIEHLVLLLFSRILLTAVVYGGVLWLLQVQIMYECIDFAQKKLGKK